MPQGQYPLQLRLSNLAQFPRISYLRIKEEQWIENEALQEWVDWVPLATVLGELLDLIKERHLEKVRSTWATPPFQGIALMVDLLLHILKG